MQKVKSAFGPSKEKPCLLDNSSLLKYFKSKVGSLESGLFACRQNVGGTHNNLYPHVPLTFGKSRGVGKQVDGHPKAMFGVLSISLRNVQHLFSWREVGSVYLHLQLKLLGLPASL